MSQFRQKVPEVLNLLNSFGLQHRLYRLYPYWFLQLFSFLFVRKSHRSCDPEHHHKSWSWKHRNAVNRLQLQDMFDKGQVLKRGYDKLVKGKNILVVEDVTTTGASVKKVVDQVKKAGGRVRMVFVLVNRNPEGVQETFMGAPFKALAVVKADAYDERECPLCQKNIPINTEVGHGKEYVAHKKAQ